MAAKLAHRHDILLRAFEAAVEAALPGPSFKGVLPAIPEGKIIILAAGKAAASMTKAAEDYYLMDLNIDETRMCGIAVTRYGYATKTRIIPVVEAGHPIPDESGLSATRRVLDMARNAREDDLILALLSGGGSANWTAPAPPLDIETKQKLTRALLRSGANIHEINTVRKHLSLIKGGRLSRLAFPAKVFTIAISDVPHDDLSCIASGPTTPDLSTIYDAQSILSKYNLNENNLINSILSDISMESPKPGDQCFSHGHSIIIARPRDSINAACSSLAASGFAPVVLGYDIEGEARDVARRHAHLALQHASDKRKVALISGGELTVSVRGAGEGGPNQEYALSLAIALDGAENISALAADTDGTDGGSGSANDPAGAVVDEMTIRNAQRFGMIPNDYLLSNNSTSFFRIVGGLLTPGPTLTNVNDLRIILIDQRND